MATVGEAIAGKTGWSMNPGALAFSSRAILEGDAMRFATFDTNRLPASFKHITSGRRTTVFVRIYASDLPLRMPGDADLSPKSI